MKKKLSFLLSLIFVLTLAFSALPVAGAAVVSDIQTLPQTGGISPATLLSLIGLSFIATGGTVFTILRKKNHGKDN